MKHAWLTLALGLAVGVGSHFAYYRLNRPAMTATLEDRLAWMKTELQLSDAQFARLRDIHQASGPRLRTIAAQAAGLHSEFLAFERIRRAEDRVDFVGFARYVELRRRLIVDGHDSTRQLVLAAAEIMTPGQRQRYLRLIESGPPPAPLPPD